MAANGNSSKKGSQKAEIATIETARTNYTSSVTNATYNAWRQAEEAYARFDS